MYQHNAGGKVGEAGKGQTDGRRRGNSRFMDQ